MLKTIDILKLRVFRRYLQRSLSVVFALAATTIILGLGTERAQASGSFLELGNRTQEPSGAAGLCDRYAWACANTASGMDLNRAVFREIMRINRTINRSVRAVSDRQQYGVADYWSYPDSGAGDCEDFALAKMRQLVAMGIPANRLLLATVHSSLVGPHAVLVIRMNDGDYVLDNLKDDILPWRATSYTFLKVQSPDAPGVWLTAFGNRS